MNIKKNKIGAIIQVRMNSSRLPGKVLLSMNKRSSLWWTIKRISYCNLIDQIIIATTLDKSNDLIENEFNNIKFEFNNLSIFRYDKNEDDVIGRVLSAATADNIDIIIDITGDCNIIDPLHMTSMINNLIDNNVDYVSNCLYRDWPDGFDVQVYWTYALQKCVSLFHPKQHCGWNIPQHRQFFSCIHYPAYNYHYPDWRLTLDTKEDYEVLKHIFEKFADKPNFKAEEIIDYIKENMWLIDINKNIRTKTPEEG